ncbi:MAG: NAD(P)H-binding protein [Hyphomicrobiales bacterium]|nr:NAD(P)H-binding protein [Hyphomicrobiales bacterium]
MKIAVTAVSGQLGQAIVEKLKETQDSANIVGLARTPENAQGLGIEVRAGDYDAPEQLKASLDGVDAVLLVSGKEAPDKRIRQHRNVIAAARNQGVKKIVYTSIQGPDKGTEFSPIVQSNRQTEADIRESGLLWAIGRNGIYIEPDVEYIESYRKSGEVANSAADGKCSYTTRSELAYAYVSLLTGSAHDGATVNLHGELLTQRDLIAYLNKTFNENLVYREQLPAEFEADRIAELEPVIGKIIAGIYHGIRIGAFDNPSDFEDVTGRPHQSWDDYFRALIT